MMIDEPRPLLLGPEECEPIHPVHLDCLAEERLEGDGDGGGHVVDRGDPLGLDLADQWLELGNVRSPRRLRLATWAKAAVQPPNLPPPLRIVRPVGQGQDRQVAALVDDPAPEFPGLPPSLVARIGPQDQQGPQGRPEDLVGVSGTEMRRVASAPRPP